MAAELVILTTASAASDENFVNMTIILFHCIDNCHASY